MEPPLVLPLPPLVPAIPLPLSAPEPAELLCASRRPLIVELFMPPMPPIGDCVCGKWIGCEKVCEVRCELTFHGRAARAPRSTQRGWRRRADC